MRKIFPPLIGIMLAVMLAAYLHTYREHYNHIFKYYEDSHNLRDGSWLGAIEATNDLILAKMGNIEAQKEISEYYRLYERNDAAAFEWDSLAARQGNQEAQYHLCSPYYYNNSIVIPKKEALTWCQKAANQGQSDAQYELCRESYNKLDYAEAINWCNAAAKKYEYAQFMLGTMYEKGNGVPQNYYKAYELYKQSAYSPTAISPSRYRLGLLYKEGKGVPHDSVSAYMWFLLSENHEVENEVKIQLASLKHDMTLEQLKKSQDQADEMKVNWQKKLHNVN